MAQAAIVSNLPSDRSLIDRDWPAVIASAICLIFSVGTITLYSFGVFVRPLAHDFGWSRTQLSGAVAIGQYAFALSSPLWGYLIDRFGPRSIVLPSVVGLSAGVASLALLTPHLWNLYLIFALIPLLGGGASPLGYGAVLVRRFERNLGLALGLALMGVGIGAAVLSPLAQKLVTLSGWRDAYAILGGLTLLITLPAAYVATRNARGPAAHRADNTTVDIAPLIWTRPFLLMCAAFFLLGIISIGVVAHLVPMMIDRGFPPLAAAGVASLTGLAAIVSRGGIGWVLDRVQAPRVLAVIALVAGGSFLLLAFDRGHATSYLAALLLGTVAGAEVAFIAFMVRRYYGPAAFGRLYGLAFGLFILGSGTGPLLLGYSFDHLGGYHTGLLAFVGLAVLVAALSLAMPRYQETPPLATV